MMIKAYLDNASEIALVSRFWEDPGAVWVVLASEQINTKVKKKKRAFI